MKAIVTTLALLSFVAASAVPYVANAQTRPATTAPHKTTTHKKMVKKVSHQRTSKKSKKPINQL